MNIYSPKKMILSICIGMILGGIVLFGLYTLYQDHVQIQAVVSYLNQVTSAQQKSADGK